MDKERSLQLINFARKLKEALVAAPEVAGNPFSNDNIAVFYASAALEKVKNELANTIYNERFSQGILRHADDDWKEAEQLINDL